MPSPVPAGYTRGPILFLRPAATGAAAGPLLQRVWNEAGAYGSRIAVLAIGAAAAPEAGRVAALFRAWESEQVTLLSVENRAAAAQWGGAESAAGAAELQRATAIVLVSYVPLQAAALLGGTPLAQAIRRANAQNKAVAALGAGGAILCQHMAVWAPGEASALQFAPGLGIVNRVLLECAADAPGAAHARLADAVGYNPFLVGVGLSADSGAVIYPNAQLEAIGAGEVQVVDGSQLLEAATPGVLAAAATAGTLAAAGVAVHSLQPGGTFNFDTRVVHTPAEHELELQSAANKAAF